MLKSTFYGAILAAIVAITLLLYFLPHKETALSDYGVSNNTLSQSISENAFLLADVRLFDGNSITQNTSLMVSEGRIQKIGTDLNPHNNMSIIEGKGKTLIPGLVDSHTHSWDSALEDALNFGVTTHLDMFTFPEILKSSREQDQIEFPQKAKLYSAGMLATAPGGHGTQFGAQIETLTDPLEAAAWIDRRIVEGSDYIKLVYMPYQSRIPSLSREIAKALITAAHERNLLIVAHIFSQKGAKDLIEDGIDGLVHIFADTPITQEFIQLSVEKNIFIIPTLTIIANIDGLTYSADQIENPNVSPYLSRAQKQTLEQSFSPVPNGFNFEIAKENVRKLYQAGVPILAGSDAPNPGTTYGATMHKEMELLVASGLSSIDALKAGTSLISTVFNFPEIGHIKEGMPANMLLIEGKPDMDIRDSLRLDTIFHQGRRINRSSSQSSSQNTPSISETLIADETLGDFESGLMTSQGFIWSETSDKIANGQSIASISRIMEAGPHGKTSSNWSLRVTGETKSGFSFPWSGAFLSFSRDFSKAYSIGPYSTIEFDIKGIAGDYQLMIFSTNNTTNPDRQSFSVTQEWRSVSLSLDQFSTLDKTKITGLSIVKGPELGMVNFTIDNVRLAR